MIPITRKEYYLNRIVGNNDYPIPEKPITIEEFFFAEILGEAVQAPEPLTRYQMYLAKIAGRNIEIPYPETRLEYFLAKACGMDIETPTPITREEIFWSNYSAIADFEVEGVPPLTYKAIEGTLENYRIYGNTVNGENVGDLITEGEHAGEYSVPVTVEGKNLVPNTATSKTVNGVTFTVNSDGSVTCNTDENGATAEARFYLVGNNGRDFKKLNINANAIITGCPLGGNKDTYSIFILRKKDDMVPGYYNTWAEIGNGWILPYSETNKYVIFIKISTGTICNNLTFYPMIRLDTIDDDTYEPYHAPVTTPIYLPEPLKKGRIYGFHIDPSVSSSSDAVTYLADAVGKTPAAMGANTFSYGDWADAFFMPKPCMLKSDGTVDYYLDPNDYTKKADGTPSDVANANYDGNAMMEWGKIWYKFVPTETDGEVSFYVADYKADNDYYCWCNIDSQNNETDHFYTAIYNGTGTLKLRSISGVALTSANGNGGTTVTQEVERATANNTTNNVEWYTEVYSDRMLINMLLILMGKSLNSQVVYGRGLDAGGQTAKEAYVTGALNDKGLFWGDISAGTSGVKVFGMENYWGCCCHRTAGFISRNNHAYVKLTYGTADGSSTTGYNQTGTGYLDFGTTSNTDGYVKTMKYNRKGLIPSTTGETGVNQNNYYGDYYYRNRSTGTTYLLLGGEALYIVADGSNCYSLYFTPSYTVWYISAALSCKPLSKGSKPHTPDYIDYAAQKRRNSDGTESSVTLPGIAVTAGTNTLTVGTAVQPSKVYIKGEKERE